MAGALGAMGLATSAPPAAPATSLASSGAAAMPTASTDAVAAAFAAHPRTGFLPPELRAQAAHDGPLPIGHGQTNSQPRTVASMLRLLQVEPGMRVLDVGAGSGWSTALLAHLVGAQGEVRGVELVPELARFGAANLAATRQPWASIAVATPGVLGLPDQAPFDRILVSAEPKTLPQSLVDQLRDGGVMVIPVAGEMLRVVRRGAQTEVTRHGGYRFVPLK
ncbi:hypothetical protein [Ottowia sp. SB7-C50]|uniref:protein-L-isoaspartate O-methyltransferase family protein n=1 Tax=Ottowia sp. SB7-C50 TaxID=3081231 RepID=UPI0029553AD9|nr:hypothetical protein [Ottowia sp. SB7-C50]WOP15589.1 hypothetical protein R0D99_00440 [Ottowia sp. SB7-C50]